MALFARAARPLLRKSLQPRNLTTSRLIHASRQSAILSVVNKLSVSAVLAFTAYHTLPLSTTSGPSMLPTILVSDAVVWNPYHRRGRGVHAGDLVTALSPYQPGGAIVKRVVGMPGDVVCVLNAHHAASGPPEISDETQAAAAAAAEAQNTGVVKYITVPAGHCWVEGDNVPWSVDSRHYGPLPLALVVGKVVAIRGDKPWSWHWVGSDVYQSVKSVDDVVGD